jgi:Uma2 family endonuclease
MSESARTLATASDLAAMRPDAAAEILGGAIVEKATPSFEHGDAQAGVAQWARNGFRGRGSDGRPGGWWIATEVEVELAKHEVYRPDVVGWRREHVPERPSGRPVRVRPDWICEVLSPSHRRRDLVDKFRVLQRVGVPHYWILDPESESFTVYRWQPEGYLVVLTATRDDIVRAEPFEAVELRVDVLFGADVDER